MKAPRALPHIHYGENAGGDMKCSDTMKFAQEKTGKITVQMSWCWQISWTTWHISLIVKIQ